MAIINCFECNKEISNNAISCPYCGVPVKPKSPSNPKSKAISIVLALFLGGVGLHKFYLNRYGQGLLYFLLCWTFIPVVISFLDALNYLCMSDELFQKRYAK